MTSIVPFICEDCGKVYASRDSLREHTKRKHPITKAELAFIAGAPPVTVENGVDLAAKPTVIDIRRNSICFVIRTSRMTVRRTVSKGDARVESTVAGKDPDQEMVTVAKDLLDSPELRAIATFDHVTKLRVKARSVPSPLFHSSAYLVSVDGLADMYEFLEQRKAARAPLEAAFEKAYPALVDEAKKRLGSLYDPTQYPPPRELRSLFSFEWQVVEVGTPDAKLRSVSQALFEKERTKAEQVWSSAVGQINEALAEGMADVVAHLSERLGAGDEPPKRFRESAIRRVTDFLDAFKQRNITENADLAKLVGNARRLLSGVDAKTIKEEGGTRKRVVAGFAEIKKSLDTMLESKPARAISLVDEEV